MEIFKLFGRLLIDSTQAENSISETSKKAEGLGDKLQKGIGVAKKWGGAVVGAATLVGGAMVGAAKGTAETLDVVDKASQRMGIAAETYQEMAHAAGLSGVEVSKLEEAAKKLVNTDMNMDEALAYLAGITDESERAAKAQELFGETAYDLTPLLNAGAEGYAAMKQEARDLGLVLSNETVASGAAMNDMFSKVEASLGIVKNTLMADLMPYVMEILQWIIDNLPLIQETVGKVADAIMPIVEPILTGVLELVKAAFSLLNGDIDGFCEGIKNVLLNLAEALYNLGEKLLQSLWDGVKSIWENFKSWMDEKINWVKDKLTFWKDSSDEMDSEPSRKESRNLHGRHASGLAYVPFDGYKAELHRGETVLNAGDTASLLEQMQSIANNSSGGVKSVNVTLTLDGAVLAKKLFNFMGNESAIHGRSLVEV